MRSNQLSNQLSRAHCTVCFQAGFVGQLYTTAGLMHNDAMYQFYRGRFLRPGPEFLMARSIVRTCRNRVDAGFNSLCNDVSPVSPRPLSPSFTVFVRGRWDIKWSALQGDYTPDGTIRTRKDISCRKTLKISNIL